MPHNSISTYTKCPWCSRAADLFAGTRLGSILNFDWDIHLGFVMLDICLRLFLFCNYRNIYFPSSTLGRQHIMWLGFCGRCEGPGNGLSKKWRFVILIFWNWQTKKRNKRGEVYCDLMQWECAIQLQLKETRRTYLYLITFACFQLIIWCVNLNTSSLWREDK